MPPVQVAVMGREERGVEGMTPKAYEKILVYTMEFPLTDELDAQLRELMHADPSPVTFDMEAQVRTFFTHLASQGNPLSLKMDIVERLTMTTTRQELEP
jgi:hypothetical protein